MTEDSTVKLVSKEGDVFDVPRKVAMMSKLVRDTFDDDEEDDDDDEEAGTPKEIPLPNVSTPVLAKVVDYCTYFQTEEEMTPIQTPLKSSVLDELVQKWYADFCKVDRNLLFDLVAAGNFMDIKPLLDLTCLAVSILIKGKSAAELREMFSIRDPAEGEEES